MPLSSEEDEFLEVASVALPRIIEIIATFLAEHRAGAFEVAERRYMQAARDFGCTEEAATRWVAPAETIAAWPSTRCAGVFEAGAGRWGPRRQPLRLRAFDPLLLAH
jgi:hypothetical protein